MNKKYISSLLIILVLGLTSLLIIGLISNDLKYNNGYKDNKDFKDNNKYKIESSTTISPTKENVTTLTTITTKIPNNASTTTTTIKIVTTKTMTTTKRENTTHVTTKVTTTSKVTTTRKPDLNLNNLTALKSIENYYANNLKITIDNNLAYLVLNDTKYELAINNVIKMYSVRHNRSTMGTLYILTNEGSLYYSSSLSTVREYKNEDIDNIKRSFQLSKADKKVINLYQTKDSKLVYEDSNNNYYYLP